MTWQSTITGEGGLGVNDAPVTSRKPKIPGKWHWRFLYSKWLITHLSFRLNITAKFHFLSTKTDKVTWILKNYKFHKNGKNRLNNFLKSVYVIKLCHGTIFNFFPTKECWCDEPLWRSQLKNSLKVILGYWKCGDFEKNRLQFRIFPQNYLK